jgi:hypothetical protein
MELADYCVVSTVLGCGGGYVGVGLTCWVQFVILFCVMAYVCNMCAAWCCCASPIWASHLNTVTFLVFFSIYQMPLIVNLHSLVRR